MTRRFKNLLWTFACMGLCVPCGLWAGNVQSPTPAKTVPAAVQSQATEEEIDLSDIAGSVQAWAEENLDQELLDTLGEVDTAKVEQLFGQLQNQLDGEYVVDLAQLREAAQTALPLLRQHPETAHLASWLSAQMDYLDVAQELEKKQPKAATNAPAPAKVNPAPRVQRELWMKKVSQPWPAAAKPYIPILKPVFTNQKLPGELVWIAEVESAFDPRARSPVGATGLFQLMPDTARQYGLRINPFDQRKNPEKNAQAAAQHLSYLYRKFKDWRLVLAAYNAGEGRVGRLLKRYKARTYDEIATRLPAETQMYVPRIEAVLMKREGVRLVSLKGPV